MKDNIVIFDSIEEEYHSHSNIEIIYIIEGALDIWQDGRKARMKRGNLWIVNSNKSHSVKCNCEVLYGKILIDYNWLCDSLGLRPVIFDNDALEKNVKAVNQIQIVVNQQIDYYLNDNGKSAFYGKSLYYQLVDTIVSNCLSGDGDWNGREPKRIRKITEYIYEHYNESISLNQLADKLFVSNAYMSRYFKKSFHMNFTEYLNKVRLERATGMLENTDIPITRIALECGYANPSVFNRRFREGKELTPSAYRRMYRSMKYDDEDQSSGQAIEKAKIYYKNHSIEKMTNTPVKEYDITVDAGQAAASGKSRGCLINIGACKDILRSDVQQHILVLKQKVGVDYLRFWTPFSKSMMIDIGNPHQEYNFDNLDKVLDFLILQDIKPFIDLGSKPRRIQKSAMEWVVFEDDGEEFEDLEQWEHLLEEWVIHLAERYGEEKVEKWCFELWRDEKKGIAQETYLEWFDVTYETVKRVLPNAQVGGFGLRISSHATLVKELGQWKKRRHLPDFLSIYLFAYEMNGEDEVQRSSNPNFIDDTYETLKRGMHELDFPDMPIYATEWNITISERNVVNDTCARAAYLLHSLIRWKEELSLMGVFSGSDCLAEHSDTRRLLFGASGLVTKNGIMKPSAYAVQFANSILNYTVERGSGYLITTDKRGNYDIICDNFKQFSYLYYLHEENEIDAQGESSVFENMEMMDYRFCLNHMANGNYEIRRYVINDEQGSIFEKWRDYHFSKRIGFEDINYFRHSCMPGISIHEQNVEDGKMNFAVKLAPHEINHIQIKFLHKQFSL